MLAECMMDPHPGVRLQAAYWLAALQLLPEKTIPVLIALLRDEVPKHRREAATAIGFFHSEAAPAAEALIQALEDRTAAVRRAAAEALSRMGPSAKAALPLLTRALLNPDMRVAGFVATAIIGTGDAAKPVLEALTRTLADPEPAARLDAAYSLALLRCRGRIDKSDPDGFISTHPAPIEVVPILSGILSDTEPERRRRAVEGLRLMMSRAASAIGALLAAMQDSSWPERWRAAYALGWLGAAGRAAIDENKDVVISALSTAQASPEDELRPHALEMLERLKK